MSLVVVTVHPALVQVPFSNTILLVYILQLPKACPSAGASAGAITCLQLFLAQTLAVKQVAAAPVSSCPSAAIVPFLVKLHPLLSQVTVPDPPVVQVGAGKTCE